MKQTRRRNVHRRKRSKSVRRRKTSRGGNSSSSSSAGQVDQVQTLGQLLLTPSQRTDFEWILERSSLAQHFIENIDDDDDDDQRRGDADVWARIGRSGEHARLLPVCREDSSDAVQFLQTMDGWAIDVNDAPLQFMQLIVGADDRAAQGTVTRLNAYMEQIDAPRRALVERLVALRTRSTFIQKKTRDFSFDGTSKKNVNNRLLNVLFAFSGDDDDAVCSGRGRADGLFDAFLDRWVFGNVGYGVERMANELEYCLFEDFKHPEIIQSLFRCSGLLRWVIVRVLASDADKKDNIIDGAIHRAFKYSSVLAMHVLRDLFSTKNDLAPALTEYTDGTVFASTMNMHILSASFVDEILRISPNFAANGNSLLIASGFKGGVDNEGVDGAIQMMRRNRETPPAALGAYIMEAVGENITRKMAKYGIPWDSELMSTFLSLVDSAIPDPETVENVRDNVRNSYDVAMKRNGK